MSNKIKLTKYQVSQIDSIINDVMRIEMNMSKCRNDKTENTNKLIKIFEYNTKKYDQFADQLMKILIPDYRNINDNQIYNELLYIKDDVIVELYPKHYAKCKNVNNYILNSNIVEFMDILVLECLTKINPSNIEINPSDIPKKFECISLILLYDQCLCKYLDRKGYEQRRQQLSDIISNDNKSCECICIDQDLDYNISSKYNNNDSFERKSFKYRSEYNIPLKQYKSFDDFQ